jgi:predicted Zn-dependent peptidase
VTAARKDSARNDIIRKDPAYFHTSRLEAFDTGWRARALPNGMTALHVPMPHDDHFFLGVMIKAGSRLESGDHPPGVSHFLEHMMFRGSARYPEFTRLAEAFEWLGGDWNAATGQEHTEYWYSGIRHTAPEVIELFADFLESPQLTDVETERNIILRELDGETNDHGHSTDLD